MPAPLVGTGAPGPETESDPTPLRVALLLLSTLCVLDAYMWFGLIGSGRSLAILRSDPGTLAVTLSACTAAALLGTRIRASGRRAWAMAAAAAVLPVATVVHLAFAAPDAVVGTADLLVAVCAATAVTGLGRSRGRRSSPRRVPSASAGSSRTRHSARPEHPALRSA